MRTPEQWVKDHEVLSWIGIVLGFVGLATSTTIAGTLAGNMLLVGSGAVLGVLGFAIISDFSSKSNVHCSLTKVDYSLSGRRGETSKRKITTTLRVLSKELPTFDYAVARSEGVSSGRVVKVRRTRNRQESPWHQLIVGTELVVVEDPFDVTAKTTQIRFPWDVRKDDTIDVEDSSNLKDAFPGLSEFVGKRAIYPVQKVEFTLRFSGCQPSNAVGKIIAYRDTGDGGEGINVTPAGADFEVRWTTPQSMKAKQACRVSWVWVE